MIKGSNKRTRKVKPSNVAAGKRDKLRLTWDEDIASSSDEDNTDKAVLLDSEDDSDETAEQKRIRMARLYLNEVEKGIHDDEEEEKQEEYDSSISKISAKLRRDRLEYQRKLLKSYSNLIERKPMNEVTINCFSGHNQSVTTVSLSSDASFLVSGSKDNAIIRYDVESGSKIYLTSRWKKGLGHSRYGEVLATAISTDGKYIASGGRDKMVRVYDARTNEEIKVFEGHRDTVTSLCFKQDSYSLFSGSLDRCLKHWDLNEMGYLETLFGHQEGVHSVDIWNRDRPVSSSGDRTIRLWNTATDTHLVFRGHEGSIDNVQMITDDMFITGGQDGNLCLWKETQKRCIASATSAHGFEGLSSTSKWISSLCAIKMSDVVLSGSNDGNLKFWSVAKREEDTKAAVREINSLPIAGFINSIAVSKDIVAVGTGREHKYGRWSVEKGNKNKVYVFKLDLGG